MRLFLLAAVWLVLTNGEPAGWGFGLVVVGLVWLAAGRRFPPSGYSIKPMQMPLFLGWFLLRSLAAGWDVSRRLLAPSLPIRTGERSLTLTLPGDSPRWLLANLLSLMPGTLTVEIRGSELLLHCLDTRQNVAAIVAEAESRVARLFGVELPAEHPS